MKNRGFISLFYGFMILIILGGCAAVTNGGDERHVYVAGSVRVNSVQRACYWEDGVRHDLEDAADGNAFGIAVLNGHVYVVGTYGNPACACVWIDGNRQYLSGGQCANGIAVAGGSIYISGYTSDNKACVWVNGTRYDADEESSWANAVAVGDDAIYLAGAKGDEGYSIATVWSLPISGGSLTKHVIPFSSGYDYSEALSITVRDGTIFVSGYQNKAADGNDYPFLWSRTGHDPFEAVLLPTPNAFAANLYAHAFGVRTDDGRTYVAGYYNVDDGAGSYYTRAALWIDSNDPVVYDLAEENDAAAFSVFIDDGDIYVAGNIEKPTEDHLSTYAQPCYWKNGVRVELTAPAIGGAASDYFQTGAHAIVVQSH